MSKDKKDKKSKAKKSEKNQNFDLFADNIADTPKDVEQNVKKYSVGDVDYIKSLYPNATHPETMTYQQQNNIGGEVVESKPAVKTKPVVGQSTPVEKPKIYAQKSFL